LIAGGELDKAQALVDSLNELSANGSPVVAPGLNGEQITLANAALREGDLARIQEQIDAGNLIAPVSIDTTDFQSELDAAAAELNPPPAWTQMFSGDNLMSGITRPDPSKFGIGAAGGKGGGEWWTNMTPPPETVSAISNFGTDTETALEQAALATSLASLDMNEYFVAISDGIISADEQIALSTTGNTMTTSFESVASSAQISFGAAGGFARKLATDIQALDIIASGHIAHMTKLLKDLQFLSAQVAAGVEAALKTGGGLPGVQAAPVDDKKTEGGRIQGGENVLVGENGPELITANTNMAVLNNRTTRAIMGGMSGGGGSTTNIYVNTTQNIANEAQASAYGYELGKQIRGMA